MTENDATPTTGGESPATAAPAGARPAKLQLKEIRIALGDQYKPIINVAESHHVLHRKIGLSTPKPSRGSNVPGHGL